MIAESPKSPIDSCHTSRKTSLLSTPIKKKGGLDAIICKDAPNMHFHIPIATSLQEIPANTIEWMKMVEVQSPAILYSSQSLNMVRSLQPDLWTCKQYRLSSEAKLFARVFETKIYSDEEKHFQLTFRVGNASCKSCISDKNGNIEDWFLINIDDSVDLATSYCEIIMETVPDLHYKQQKHSTLKLKASELMASIARAGSIRKNSLGSNELPQTGIARIPLSSFLSLGPDGKPCSEVGGKFLIKGFKNQKMGEVTMHMSFHPTSIESCNDFLTLKNFDDIIMHQAYISYEVQGEWKRYWGILTRDELHLRDSKYRKNIKSSSMISLSDLVKLDMVSGSGELNDIGLENCLELEFEDGSELYMYADSQEEVSYWAEAVSQAVWGQPFSS